MAYKIPFQLLRRVSIPNNNFSPKYPEFVGCLAVKQPGRGVSTKPLTKPNSTIAPGLSDGSHFHHLEGFKKGCRILPKLKDIKDEGSWLCKESRFFSINKCKEWGRDKSDSIGTYLFGTEKNPMVSSAQIYHLNWPDQKFEFPGGRFSELCNFKNVTFENYEGEDKLDRIVVTAHYTYMDRKGVMWDVEFHDGMFSLLEESVSENSRPLKSEDSEADESPRFLGTKTNPNFNRCVIRQFPSGRTFVFPGGPFHELENFIDEICQNDGNENSSNFYINQANFTYVNNKGMIMRATFLGGKHSELKDSIRGLSEEKNEH